MIAQLDNDLWRDIFLADNLLNREDVAFSFGKVWDKYKSFYGGVCWALGVFQLKPDKKDFGQFVLVKSYYKKFRDTRDSFKTNYLFSFAENYPDALLKFLPYLTPEEQVWLNVHLFLKDHPAYQG